MVDVVGAALVGVDELGEVRASEVLAVALVGAVGLVVALVVGVVALVVALLQPEATSTNAIANATRTRIRRLIIATSADARTTSKEPRLQAAHCA